MSLLKVLVLAVVQGLAELLPVSSSAHVVVAEKLMGLDPAAPDMTLLLVMLHTGTMFAVIVYFWSQWRRAYFASTDAFKRFAIRAAWATVLTAVVGYPIKKIIEHMMDAGIDAHSATGKAEIEQLFGRLDLVAYALFAAGLLILYSGLRTRAAQTAATASAMPDYARGSARSGENVTFRQAGVMGAVQGLALPFRGFSRSGTTISAGLLADTPRERAEKFSFALAVILTPAVVVAEALRLVKSAHVAATAGTPVDLHGAVAFSLIGMVASFGAGLAALRWLSTWLESGKWYLFGVYCVVASGVIFYLHTRGF